MLVIQPKFGKRDISVTTIYLEGGAFVGGKYGPVRNMKFSIDSILYCSAGEYNNCSFDGNINFSPTDDSFEYHFLNCNFQGSLIVDDYGIVLTKSSFIELVGGIDRFDAACIWIDGTPILEP